MVTDTSEKNIETILVSYLCDSQGYEESISEDYSKDYALDTERVKRFILSTQKKRAENTVPEIATEKQFNNNAICH